MSATFELDSSGFRRAIGGLAQFTGASVRHIIRAEAGSILKACVGDTKVATVADAEAGGRARAFYSITAGGQASTAYGKLTINSGRRGGIPGWMWHRTPGRKFQTAGLMNVNTGSFRWANIHFTDAVFNAMRQGAAAATAALQRLLPAARGSIGLARQSWVQIADDAGIHLEAVPGGRTSAAAIAKARRAIASTGVRHSNGAAREYVENKTFVLELINGLPYGRKIQLDSILAKNINGRARFFEENLSRGVFDSIAKIARAYPGLRIQLN